jgi:hypothetical protein
MKMMSDSEERIHRAFRMLFYFQGKTRKEIEEMKKKLEDLEQCIRNLYRTGDN